MKRKWTAIIVVMGLALALPGGATAAKPASDVNVVNTPANAVPVYQALAPNQIFRMVFTGTVPLGAGFGDSVQHYTVPANTLLVIELVSGHTFPPSGQIPFCYIFVHNTSDPSAPNFEYFVPLTNLGIPGASDIYQGTSLVRIYAEAGESVLLQFYRSGGDGVMNFSATLSGYLVALPAP